MFWPDVVALKEFYASPLGQIAYDAISHRIRSFWGNVNGETILGIGFTTPYLAQFLGSKQTVIACMPAQQGVIHWPAQAKNLSLLADEAELPFADNSVHKLLLVHSLENSEQARQMMTEIWRVLAPTGKLLAVVPNRRGIWARAPQSPFAYGQPFTSSQLRQLLSEHPFTPLQMSAALFVPPLSWRWTLRCAPFIEKIGRHFFPGFGGILLMEAEKRIYAPTLQKERMRPRKSYIPVPQPAAT